jgi:hypothetical protein
VIHVSRELSTSQVILSEDFVLMFLLWSLRCGDPCVERVDSCYMLEERVGQLRGSGSFMH